MKIYNPTLTFRQRGVAAVEFGLLIGLLVILVFGITEYGRAIYQYNTMAKGVRNAVRYLTAYAPGNSTASSAAKCLAVFGNTACSGNTLVPNLSISQVSIQDASNAASHALQSIPGGGVANLVTVTVSGYQFTSLMTLVAPSFAFNTISATMVQP